MKLKYAGCVQIGKDSHRAMYTPDNSIIDEGLCASGAVRILCILLLLLPPEPTISCIAALKAKPAVICVDRVAKALWGPLYIHALCSGSMNV